MSIISGICFALCGGIILTCFWKGADIFSPFRVFGLTWFFSIGLTELKLSRFQHDWSALSWSVMLIGVFSFLIGLYIVYTLSINRKINTPIQIRSLMKGLSLDEGRFYFAIVFLSLIYLISFVVESLVHGELPIFSSDPDDSRKKFGVFGIHLFVTAMPVILFFIVQYYVLFTSTMKKKMILGLFFILIFVSYFTLLVRFNYIMFIFMTACFIYYSSSLFSTKNIIIAIAGVVLMFYFTLQIREARYAENFIYVISDMKFSKTYASLAGPYMYITMNLENIARVIDNLDQFTYGYYSFDFVFALTGLKHQLASYYGLEERIFLNSSFNTFPYFYPFYRDFGVTGVMIFSLVLGFITGNVHMSVKTNPTLLNISLYAFCVFFMLLSFFANPLTMLNNIFMLFLIVMINHFIGKKYRIGDV
jgi:oligosaccharide repeat unit polymerase